MRYFSVTSVIFCLSPARLFHSKPKCEMFSWSTLLCLWSFPPSSFCTPIPIETRLYLTLTGQFAYQFVFKKVWYLLTFFRMLQVKGDLRTICRFSYMKVYKLITLGTKFKTLLSLGRKITMFSKFITNYIEQGWWHSSLTLKYMHLLLKEVNKRGRHAYNLHGWTCLPSGIVMEIHCHITGIF